MTESRYEKLGVDIHKKGIEVFKPSIRSLFSNAFCTVKQDPQFPEYALIAHADGAGSKPVQSFLNYKETGEVSAFKGIGQDVVAMNLNDIACVGAAPISFVDYVALNRFKIPKEDLLSILNSEFIELGELLRTYGVTLPFDGGETADLPDQLSTLDVSGFMEGRVKLSKVISGEEIRSGNKIVGLRSGGKARYENKLNSGIMCNGITLARHCLMASEYEKKYPEILGKDTPGYSGRYKVGDYVDELEMTIDAAITSPTRIFAPVVFKILNTVDSSVTGLVHNTGGGQTKCLKVGRGLRYVKHLTQPPDPIFTLIQKESGESWRDMYQNFNMGVGFEVILEQEAVDRVLSIAESLGVEAREIGHVESSPDGNQVVIESNLGKFDYNQM
jgi:phosphoribosylformylglycinamidine cyclo-ligase